MFFQQVLGRVLASVMSIEGLCTFAIAAQGKQLTWGLSSVELTLPRLTPGCPSTRALGLLLSRTCINSARAGVSEYRRCRSRCSHPVGVDVPTLGFHDGLHPRLDVCESLAHRGRRGPQRDQTQPNGSVAPGKYAWELRPNRLCP